MRSVVLGLLLFTTSAAVAAEGEPLAAVEQYLTAIRSARSNKELERYFSARRIAEEADQLKKARAKKDPKERAATLELLSKAFLFAQMMDLQNPVLVARAEEGKRTRLDLTATAADFGSETKRMPATGQVWLVREKGVWKIDDERWKVNNAQPPTPAPEEIVAAGDPDPDFPRLTSMKPVAMGAFTAEPAFAQFQGQDHLPLWFADPYYFDRKTGKVPPHSVRKFETPEHPRKVYLFYKRAKLLGTGGFANSFFHFDPENEADDASACRGCADAVFYRMMQNADRRTVQILAWRPSPGEVTQVFVFDQLD